MIWITDYRSRLKNDLDCGSKIDAYHRLNIDLDHGLKIDES